RHGIGVDPRDGLLRAGEPGVQLTWMDARVGERVITPRMGKPVEVNALWYNARRILAELHARRGRTSDARAVRLAADVTRRAFVAAFWDRTTGSLVDVIGEDGTPDRAVRPNQVFAAALPFPLLTRPRARSMLTVVDRELVTPRGLRSLAPSDPAYRGRYEGDVSSRDGAYHQGTVWPWLIGPYADAVRYAFGPESAAATRVRAVLRDLATTDDVLCPGQLPELYDGDAPRRPCGCIAQAWSVAEVLRVWATQGTTRASRRNPRVRRSPGPTK
ncbi:MAG TPA: amylo-alpha-1,6-glucosidase, partial [Gemmatimonadaceae bacterium]|nr:amylo-alpha-1,6-glucosidase [Gemmatimonadaceae bacterium]